MALRHKQLAESAGHQSGNLNMTASRWNASHQVFSVKHSGRILPGLPVLGWPTYRSSRGRHQDAGRQEVALAVGVLVHLSQRMVRRQGSGELAR